jgi:S-adenosylmethionine hydrolase
LADVAAGEMLVYEDAWGAVALAVNRGDAAAALGVTRDAEVRLAPAR